AKKKRDCAANGNILTAMGSDPAGCPILRAFCEGWDVSTNPIPDLSARFPVSHPATCHPERSSSRTLRTAQSKDLRLLLPLSFPLRFTRRSSAFAFPLPERKILQNIYKAMTTATTLNLANTIALLSRTPAALDAFLRGMPDIWIVTQ